MKILNITDFINEKITIKSVDWGSARSYDYFPETKDELIDIIEEMIGDKGIKCDLNNIDTFKIIDMQSLFCGSNFNGNISEWDVSNVKDMSYMFGYSKFNQDISNWNVSKVIYFSDFSIDSPLEEYPEKQPKFK